MLDFPRGCACILLPDLVIDSNSKVERQLCPCSSCILQFLPIQDLTLLSHLVLTVDVSIFRSIRKSHLTTVSTRSNQILIRIISTTKD